MSVADPGAAEVLASGDPARFDEAHRALRADRSIQFEMEAFTPPTTPAWLRWLGQLLEGSGPFFKTIFWFAVAAFVLVLLYALFRYAGEGGLARLLRRRPREEPADEWRPEEAPARALLREADALAEAGRFDEAAHLLLFRSLEDIDRRRPNLVRPALTSRELAGAPQLPPGPRAAFTRIVMAVERSLFGGRSLGEADWTGCRTAYEEFAFAREWKA
jgi:hypothetical protein